VIAPTTRSTEAASPRVRAFFGLAEVSRSSLTGDTQSDPASDSSLCQRRSSSTTKTSVDSSELTETPRQDSTATEGGICWWPGRKDSDSLLTTGSGSLRANSRTVFAAGAYGELVFWATGGAEGAGGAGGVALKCSESRLPCSGVAACINCSTDGREKAGEGRGAVEVTGETCGEPGALVRAGAETSLEKSSSEEAQIAGLGATGAGGMAGEASGTGRAAHPAPWQTSEFTDPHARSAASAFS